MTLIETVRRIKPEEFLRLPQSRGYELVDGQLMELSVSRESSRVGSRLNYLLEDAALKSGNQVEVYNSELTYQCFAEDTEMLRRPDASVIRKNRLGAVPKDAGTMPIPADLVVEVLSPNDLASRVSRKVKLYLENGFKVVWVVDPEVRTVGIFTADAPGKVLREGDEIDAGDLLPSFRCRVGDFFTSASTSS